MTKIQYVNDIAVDLGRQLLRPSTVVAAQGDVESDDIHHLICVDGHATDGSMSNLLGTPSSFTSVPAESAPGKTQKRIVDH